MASGKREADGSTRSANRPVPENLQNQQPRLFDFARQGDGPTIDTFP